MKGQIKKFILQALLRMSGLPMPEKALNSAVQEVFDCGLADVATARRELEEDGFISQHKDSVTERVTWGLTEKGELKAKQL